MSFSFFPTRPRVALNAFSVCRRLSISAALCCASLAACQAQQRDSGEAAARRAKPMDALELPAISNTDQVIAREGYTLSYAPEYGQAKWVAYVLRGQQFQKEHFGRSNQFRPDPKAKPHSADDEDYEGSGYDRGHLAPAEDMSWSAASMRESFYYTNVSPQLPAFNRGVWKRLEELVRFWATAYDSLYVVTGPVLREGLPAIGPDKISIPERYYKVILRREGAGWQGIGFVLENEASSATLRTFALPIDSVEKLTGLDFYPRLPDEEEAKIESKAVLDDWRWTRTQTR
jgi:endonuclease G